MRRPFTARHTRAWSAVIIIWALLLGACSSSADLTVSETPTPESTATPEPTATPAATPTPAPTPTPTPVPVPTFDELTAAAAQKLDAVESLQISQTVTTDNDAEQNYTTDTVVDADFATEQMAFDLIFSGRGFGAGEFVEAAAQSNASFLYIVDEDGDIFFSLDPKPPGLFPPGRDWVVFTASEMARASGGLGQGGVVLDPASLRPSSEPLRTMELVAELDERTIGGETVRIFEVEIPNNELLIWVPSDTWNTLTLEGLGDNELTATTTFVIGFAEDELRLIEIQLDGIFDDAADVLDNPVLADTMQESVMVIANYDVPVTIEIPDDADAISIAELDPTFAEGADDQFLNAGDCLTAEELEFLAPTTIPCDEPHTIEILAVGFTEFPSDEPYPGEEALFLEAEVFCSDAYLELTGGVPSDFAVLDLLLLSPSAETWSIGDRELVCYVEFPVDVTEPFASFDPLRLLGLVSPFGVEVGDCIGNEDLAVFDWDLVDCADPHFYEVYVADQLEGVEYPGDGPIGNDVADICLAAYEPSIGTSYDVSSLFIEPLYPTSETWELGDRLVTCLVTSYDARTGSAIGSGL